MNINSRMTNVPAILMTREELISEVKRLELLERDPLTLLEGSWTETSKNCWRWEPNNKDQFWCTVVEDDGDFQVECSDGTWTYKDDHLYTAPIDLEAAKRYAVRMLIQIANAHANSVAHSK